MGFYYCSSCGDGPNYIDRNPYCPTCYVPQPYTRIGSSTTYDTEPVQLQVSSSGQTENDTVTETVERQPQDNGRSSPHIEPEDEDLSYWDSLKVEQNSESAVQKQRANSMEGAGTNDNEATALPEETRLQLAEGERLYQETRHEILENVHEIAQEGAEEEARADHPEWQEASGKHKDDASTTSTTSNCSDSVFSAESLETSATAFSREVGFSVEQIQSAMRVFLSILQEEEVLVHMYAFAISNPGIGPNRLRRCIRGALKSFAEHLKEEANDHLEFQISRLVHAKARYAARCIASGENKRQQARVRGTPREHTNRGLDSSSEEETTERPVDAPNLEDLEAFRRFLTESDAYATLQVDIHAFCTEYSTTPRDIPTFDKARLLHVSKRNTERTWSSWSEDTQDLTRSLLLGFDRSLGAKVAMYLLLDLFYLLTDDVFVAMGLLEPPFKLGWTRIRSEYVSPYKGFR